jgi:PmbA protein
MQSADDVTANLDFLQHILTRAKAKGASAADVMLVHSQNVAVTVRQKILERTEHSHSQDLGLRVFMGQRQAMVSCSYSPQVDIDDLVSRAIDMAELAPADPFAGLADAAQSLSGIQQGNIADDTVWRENDLLRLAATAEDAAQAVPGVTKTEGAEASTSQARIYLVNTQDFAGHYQQSAYAVSVSAIAGEGQAMERDYDYSGTVFAADLKPAAAIGKKAGERAVQRQNPRPIKTTALPVVFEARLAASLLRYLASAINGAGIARGTSFLKQDLGKMVFSPDITITDDPLRSRGLRSRPFDAEGLAAHKIDFIANGRLTGWVLDSRSARQLQMTSTGHAARGVSSQPSPGVTNFYLQPGKISPQDLLRQIGRGIYLTETMGMGVNLITGDYSQGASGFMIENGEIAYPISAFTVAGNLRQMFAQMIAADDLNFQYGIDSPTVAVGTMTIAGE